MRLSTTSKHFAASAAAASVFWSPLSVLLLSLIIFSSTFFLTITSAFQTPSVVIAPSLQVRHSRPNRLFLAAKETSNQEVSKKDDGPTLLHNLRVAVVGGGPSGLLVTHRLLRAGASSVHLYEKRPRPVDSTLEPRAYALGVGIRGRTAIQSVGSDDDATLWQAVARAGYASERFLLHVGPLSLRLRDESDAVQENGVKVEPSLLLFQSDLCRTLADELERRWMATSDSKKKQHERLCLNWNCGVQEINLQSKTLTTQENQQVDSYDLLVGCDGVNSVVRRAMDRAWPAFNTTQELIPGLFKVVKLPAMPPALDPTAVQLLFPKSGSVTAFVEPTVNGTCCVLFAGRNSTDPILSSSSTNRDELAQELEARYPKLAGADLSTAAQQLIEHGTPAQASRVTCNTYHYRPGAAVLVGDAAHATGGASGQGVNSALVDAARLVDCLIESFDSDNKNSNDDATKETLLARALLSYSQKAVPEGKALFDLSFGPNPTTVWGRLRLAVASARDTLFKGKFGIGDKPIQTLLTTSLRSFADIRRDRDPYYEQAFSDQAYWDATLAKLDKTTETALQNVE